MGFIKDMLPALKKYQLVFVEKRLEVGNIESFVFKPQEKLSWKPGQHGIIYFPKTKMEGGSWRGFSIASNPEEGLVMISTRILENPSSFKKALLGLKSGDFIMLRGPFGPFYYDNSKNNAVFIAGGIGITPFRSLILEFIKNRETAPNSVKLLYADDKGEFAYRDEFERAAGENPFINLNYITDRDKFWNEIEIIADEHQNNALYFISGPNSLVKAVKSRLVKMGIRKDRIKYEPFIGL